MAGVDDEVRLRRAVADVGAVVSCAGPILDTAVPLARAAVAAGVHYLDVTAEQPAVQRLYDELDAPARWADVRRTSVRGRDIYAVTAPAVAPGEAFDAADVLAALDRDVDGLVVRRGAPAGAHP